MRTPRLLAISFLTFAVTLALSGCGSSKMGSSLTGGNSNSQSGTPPTVSAVAVQVNGVAPNRAQEVQFSEAMDPATIDAQTFQVTDSSGKAATGTVSYDPDFDTASFLPSPALQPSANYTATISTAVASSGGAHLASPYTYTFTTRSAPDTSPLAVSSVDPAANATCVSATTPIRINFNEAADPETVTPGDLMVSGPNGAISTKIGMNVNTTQVVLTPASPLPSGTITVTVSNVADLAGVKMAAPYVWSFSTGCSGGGGANTFVYVGNETEIAGFEIAADGSATAVPGSPFALTGLSLAASPTSNFLFGDGQTGDRMGLTYYTYSVAADGSLSTASSTMQTGTDPLFPSTTPQWLSWIATDRTGTSLYSEQGTGNPHSGEQWVAEYAVGTSGSLSLTTAIGAQGASPISFTQDNHFGFYTVESVGFGSIEGFVDPVVRDPGGTLSANKNWQPSSPVGTPDLSVPASALVSPSTNYLAVNFFQDSIQVSGTKSGIAVYPINGDGSAGTPTAYFPSGPVQAWDSTGTYLFAGGAGGTITVLRFDSGANTLSLVDTVTPPGATAEEIDFLNGHLFAVSPITTSTQSLYVYNFANGVLTPAPGSPIPLGFNPSGLAALQH